MNKSIRAPWLCIANDFAHTSHCPAQRRSYASARGICIQCSHLGGQNKRPQSPDQTFSFLHKNLSGGPLSVLLSSLCCVWESVWRMFLTQCGVKHGRSKVEMSHRTKDKKRMAHYGFISHYIHIAAAHQTINLCFSH